jgi:uncharacterized iron-regulated membrane protein
MKPRKAAYLAHRWLGLIISLQLLAWSLGGLVFSVLDIDMVRGERGAADHTSQPFDLPLDAAPLRAIVDAARLVAPTGALLELRDRGLGLRWIVFDHEHQPLASLDPKTGVALPPLTSEQAAALAVRDRRARVTPASTELIDSDPPGEYRGKPRPAYRVALEGDERITLYIHALTGDVTARRNTQWRIFDFFWMLHIMDYKERENFNHWLLTSASVLAVVTAASGLVLWGWRATAPWVRPPASGSMGSETDT